MLRKEENRRTQREDFCVEDFVPKDHLLRKIEEAVDFSYIYELIVLFKMILLEYSLSNER